MNLSPEERAEKIASFARIMLVAEIRDAESAARRKAIEECMHAQCWECARGYPVERRSNRDVWIHREMVPRKDFFLGDCRASRLRALLAQEPE